MKMYVSKYALSNGIQEVEGYTISDSNYFLPHGRFDSHKIGRDAFFTFAEAQEAAEKSRVKKIRSLENQIAKLRELSFKT